MPAISERHTDVVVQIGGLGFALAGSALLLIRSAKAANGLPFVAVGIYGLTLLCMFVFSILNALVRDPDGDGWCKALDHSSIFALIAGTYTPFCLLVVGGRDGASLLILLWTMAALGIIARLTMRRHLAKASVTLYVGMGWVGLLVAPSVFDRLSGAGIALILAGGVVYSLAAPLHRWTALRYHSAIWHACVVIAACCHYAAVMVALNGYIA